MSHTKQVLLEALKELLRDALLAAIPVALDTLQKGELNFRLIAVAASIAVLRAIDRWVHEWAKETDRSVNGLIPF